MSSTIHTLLGAKPPARSDGKAWTKVRVQHSENEDGPWVEDVTQNLSPLDSDPTSPIRRDLTFASALSEAFFRLVFLDADANLSSPTDPVFDDGSGVDWRATVSDVASLLRARTYTDEAGQEGEFSEDTRPTKGQVLVEIGKAVNEVAARLGTDELPSDDLRSYARYVVSLRAAMAVELSYFPEDADEDRETVYKELRTLYEEGLAFLINALPDTSSTRKGIYSIPLRSDAVGYIEEPLI